MSIERIEEARQDLQRGDEPREEPAQHSTTRPDWPPASRIPTDGLSAEELKEFYLYWQGRDLEGDHHPMRDDELPVPGPEGNPISQQERERAEEAMLQEMHEADSSRPWFHNRERELEPPPAEEVREQHWFIRRQGSQEDSQDREIDRDRERQR